MPSQTEPILSCKIGSAKSISTLLSCLRDGNKEQNVYCDVTNEGLTFTVHSKAKSVQAQCHLDAQLFESFSFQKDVNGSTEHFKISLSALLDCINIFGPANLHQTSLSMHYDHLNASLSLLLEEQGVLTECEIQTLTDDDDELSLTTFAALFRSAPVHGKAIVKSNLFRDALSELSELPGASSVTIYMNSNPKFLRVSTQGESSACDIDFPEHSKLFVDFSCDITCCAKYHLAALLQAMKSLQAATETFLRINADNVLSVQHLIESSDGHRFFVDVLICSEEADDEEEDTKSLLFLSPAKIQHPRAP